MKGDELTFCSILTNNTTNKIVKRLHMKNGLFIGCDPGPRCVGF